MTEIDQKTYLVQGITRLKDYRGKKNKKKGCWIEVLLMLKKK